MNKSLTFCLVLLSVLISSCSTPLPEYPKYKATDEVVVLAHGLGRSDFAMWRLNARLKEEGYLVCTLDYSTIGESVDTVLRTTTRQIDECVFKAPKVHFIGHSLGGLVIRSYLQQQSVLAHSQVLGKVVLMGTPNKGSELADYLDESWVMKVGGEISQSLKTGDNTLGQQINELDIDIGVIAGTKSARFTKDVFDGPNDGLVSVESTKLDHMTDFIEIAVGHADMRSSEEVSKQAIHFLQHGVFDHAVSP